MHSEGTAPEGSTECTASGNDNLHHNTTRATIPFETTPTHRYYLPTKKNFAPQYGHIYFCRLTELRPHLEKSARKQFGPSCDSLKYTDRIVNISSSDHMESVIVGVVFRHANAKPSILSLYDQPSHDLIPAPPSRSVSPYAASSDKVFFEDENARCTLDVSKLGSPLPDAFGTGFVIAVKGVEEKSTGTFSVSAYASVQPAPQPTLKPFVNDLYVCLVSSLSLSTSSLAPELLLEFVKGNTGDDEEESFAAKIVHLIIAGNLIPASQSATPSSKALGIGEKERAAAPVVDADRYLSALVSSLPVSVMPGENDPANYLLPQQPLHRCMLPSSSRNANLYRVSNPFACDFDGTRVLATSGQNVTDLALYETRKAEGEERENGNAQAAVREPYDCGGERALDLMETMLTNRHIAPTCPDTLGSYPFCERDPFIVETTPHVFLAGNQNEFATRIMKAPVHQSQETVDSMEIDGVKGPASVRLISVPKFDRTGQAVLVNLRTLECIVREFALTM